ncbi:MAG: GTPase ObgE [Candidatus Binatia bacterium]|nr:GTPase ObgE [Candidatus Binatia bacterium]
MRFIDEVKIVAIGGAGGNGCVAFRREKYVPRGGPSGGDGGRGGHVLLQTDRRLGTLLDLRYKPRLKAKRGQHGRGKDQYGRRGDDMIVSVPVGTIIKDEETGDVLADLDKEGMSVIVAQGGAGGLGNIHFTSSTRQAPRIATPGEDGEERTLRLELRLLADAGLLGFPNVGKSSIITRLSAARPRVADYPFTTLVPNLGVVRIDEGTSFVLADVPGIIEGAHTGAGLGIRFLKHLSRTAVLVHVIDLSAPDGRDPLVDFDKLQHELAEADPALAAKPQIVVGNKLDLTGSDDTLELLRDELASRGIDIFGISAATGDGLQELAGRIARLLADQERQEDLAAAERERAVDLAERAAAINAAAEGGSDEDAGPGEPEDHDG